MKTVLYSKNGCMGCLASETMMDDRGITYETVMMDNNPEAVKFVKSLGYMSAPVIVVYNDNKVFTSWSGFNHDKIEELEIS